MCIDSDTVLQLDDRSSDKINMHHLALPCDILTLISCYIFHIQTGSCVLCYTYSSVGEGIAI